MADAIPVHSGPKTKKVQQQVSIMDTPIEITNETTAKENSIVYVGFEDGEPVPGHETYPGATLIEKIPTHSAYRIEY